MPRKKSAATKAREAALGATSNGIPSVPSKRTTVLDGSGSDSAVANGNETQGSKKRKAVDMDGDGLADGEASFRINEEYAKRFEHNKRREELQRCKSTCHVGS